ncbi:MAG: hypothetical protein H0Z35_12465 [Thermoanaerobacteraceae bacterium]|nr:hypothetical protein [Thermoanaerobacteraceae bacterium]
MPRKLKGRVVVTDHARRRYRERGGKGKLTSSRARRHLMGALRAGLDVKNSSIEVPLGGGLYGVCVPEAWGGWSVVTVYRQEEAG